MKKLTLFLVAILLFSCKKTENNIEGKKKKTDKSDKISEITPKTLVSKPKFSVKCNFETYIKYKDSLPLYTRPNEEITKYFRFEDDPEYDFGGGFLFKNSELGWLQIGKNEYTPELENYWVKSSYIEIGTTNYANEKIPLFEKPDKKSKIVGNIYEESSLNVLNCDSNWVYVQKEGNKGWLAPEFICTNSETNCN